MNRLTLQIAVALMCSCLTSVAAGEKVEWKKADGGNGHSYEVVPAPTGISFVDAQLAAKRKGAHLATIASKEENEFVFKLVDDQKYWGSDGYNGYGPRLGGYQDGAATETAKGWKWVTGEEWKYENWSPGAGEPNDNDGSEDHNEDYLHFFCYGSTGREAKWNDCADGMPIIVSYVVEWTPEEELPVEKAEARPAEGKPAEAAGSADTGSSADSSDAG